MRPASRDTVHVSVFLSLVRYLENSGYSLEEFGRRAGVHAEAPSDPDARVPFDVMLRGWKIALEMTGNPALGLAVGGNYSSQAHGVLGHLISHSETLGDALRVLCRYQMLLSGADMIELIDAKDEAVIVLHADEPNPATWPTVVERVFASILTISREEVVGRVSLVRVEFDYPEPEYAAAYRKFFGAPCRFRMKKNRLVFPRAQLTMAMRHRHSALHSVLAHEAETLRTRLHEGSAAVAARLWNALPKLMDRGEISARSAAEAIGVSERTLHRRLGTEGTAYLEMLDKARLERAQRLMTMADVSLEEIALACGFLETSGFYRAFKRWTGKAPRIYRQAQAVSQA